MKNDLYHQAILDAKALRAGAIANAKAMLQETFEPKIQEMLRLKLSEELSEELEEDLEESEKTVEESYETEMEEGYTEEGVDDTLSEQELDEILAELEDLEEGNDDNIEEAQDDLYEGEDPMKEADDDEDNEAADDDDNAEAEETEEVSDETKVVDITLGDLKDVLASYMAGQTADSESMDDMSGADSDLSIDEILAELAEADDAVEEGKDLEEEKDLDEGEDPIEEAKGQIPGYGNVGGKGTTGYDEKVGGKGRTGYDAGSKKLQEATKTIEILSEKLKEINLLNAKLLYMNKIFKAKTLNEAQKISVVKSFDKATSVREVKTVYEILNESMSNKTKAPLKESRMQGFASKPAGMAPKKPIVDSDPMVDRWQTLVFGNK